MKIANNIMSKLRYEKMQPKENNLLIETITLNGHEGRLQTDWSHIWDAENSLLVDDEVKMLRCWSKYLTELPKTDQPDEKWQLILDVVIAETDLAAVWRRLLIAGISAPDFYAQRIWTLLLNPGILLSLETQELAKFCLEAFASQLTDKNFSQIESLLLDKAKALDCQTENANNYLLAKIARILSSIPEEKRSSETQEILSKYLGNENLYSSRPTYQLESTRVEQLPVDSFGNPEYTPNEQLPVDLFGNPNVFLQELEEAKNLYQRASESTPLNNQAQSDLFEQLKRVIETPSAPPSPQSLEDFDRDPSVWQQLFAVEGFLCLAIKTDSLPIEWKDLLRRLADDPDPQVRSCLGQQIWQFLNKWPEFVWETLDRWLNELPNRAGTIGVLRKTLHSSWYGWLRNSDAARAEQFFNNLLTAARFCNSAELRSHCGALLTALWFFEGETWAGEALRNALDSIRDNADELKGAERNAVHELLPRSPKEPPSPVAERQRVQDFLLQLLKAANQALLAYHAEVATRVPSDGANEPAPWVKKVSDFFYDVATEFDFSAEGHAKQWTSAQTDDKEAKISAWWQTVEPILEALLAIPHPGIVFKLIEGLEHFIDLDLQRSLYWIRKATLASAPAGLVNEPLAADRTIEILSRILADHKKILLEGNELQSDFIQILESYLNVGWPKAVQLAVQIETIFR
jgi:hypothetical protein